MDAKPQLQQLNPDAIRLAAVLRAAMNPDAIYLFGSHARGDSGPDSDIDLLVVVPSSDRSRYWRAVEARRICQDVPVPKDLVVLTRSEFERECKVKSSLASVAVEEGVRIDV